MPGAHHPRLISRITLMPDENRLAWKVCCLMMGFMKGLHFLGLPVYGVAKFCEQNTEYQSQEQFSLRAKYCDSATNSAFATLFS
jgi:hypothetical protein